LAGINTEAFAAHSTRSASKSWAASKGVPISDILKAANWSSSLKFYCRAKTAQTIIQEPSYNQHSRKRYQ